MSYTGFSVFSEVDNCLYGKLIHSFFFCFCMSRLRPSAQPLLHLSSSFAGFLLLFIFKIFKPFCILPIHLCLECPNGLLLFEIHLTTSRIICFGVFQSYPTLLIFLLSMLLQHLVQPVKFRSSRFVLLSYVSVLRSLFGLCKLNEGLYFQIEESRCSPFLIVAYSSIALSPIGAHDVLM